MRTDIPQFRKNLALRLRLLRKKNGDISQFDFAYKVGIDRSFYGALERGERNTTLDKLVSIADCHNITVSDLLNGLQETPK